MTGGVLRPCYVERRLLHFLRPGATSACAATQSPDVQESLGAMLELRRSPLGELAGWCKYFKMREPAMDGNKSKYNWSNLVVTSQT